MGDYAPMSLYSMLDSQQLAIQAFPPFYDSLQVRLGYTNDRHRQLKLQIDSMSGDWSTVRLYLEDRISGQFKPMQREQAVLLAGDTTGVFANRYVLHFRQLQPTLSTASESLLRDRIQFRQNNRLLQLFELPPSARVNIYDLHGRLITEKSASGTWEQTFNGGAGIYLLRVMAGQDSWQRKIVITD
jgi:hypothetical protein